MEDKIYGDVVHIVYDELSRNYKYEKNCNQLDRRLQVVSVDDADELFKRSGIKLLNINKPVEGQILMRHPFEPNTYIDAAMKPIELFQDKVNKMGVVLQRLGVKSISGKAHWKESLKREIDANGRIGIRKFGASASYQYSEMQTECNKINIFKSYPNARLTRELYSESIEKAKQYGLYNDSQIYSLIESRNPSLGSNVQGCERVSIELSKEYNELTNIAFSLNFLKVFELGFNYKETLEIVNNVAIDLDIQF